MLLEPVISKAIYSVPTCLRKSKNAANLTQPVEPVHAAQEAHDSLQTSEDHPRDYQSSALYSVRSDSQVTYTKIRSMI